MEHIRKAIELAQNAHATDGHLRDTSNPPPLVPQSDSSAFASGLSQAPINHITLNKATLETQRIISFDNSDPRTKAFDILRTQVLQSMHAKNWQLLAVTSPTADCGKTLTAINLALSMARQRDANVLLVDLDLQKPSVANYLGMTCKEGLLGVLEGRTKLADAIVEAHVENRHLTVLPCEAPTLSSSEWMSSRAMGSLLQQIKRDFRSSIVVLDLPPLLLSDDAISILPQIDCVLFVAAVGTTTTPEIKECNKHLQSAPVVRVVLNKAPHRGNAYYY